MQRTRGYSAAGATRVRHRGHRPGRLLSRRAAARRRRRGRRLRPRSRHRAAARRGHRDRGRPARPGGLRARDPRPARPTRSTTSQRRRSCPTRGRTRPRRSRAIAGATATLLAAALPRRTARACWVSTSSEIFGDAGETPQNEHTPMRPRSPYGVAKLAAHGLVGTLREHHGLLRLLGHHLQPRVAAPAGALRAAQGHRAARPRSRRPRRTSWCSATSARCATGRTRGRRCARRSSRCAPTSPATTSSPRASAAPSATSSTPRSPTPALEREGRVRVDPALRAPARADARRSATRRGPATRARLDAAPQLRGARRRDGRRGPSGAGRDAADDAGRVGVVAGRPRPGAQDEARPAPRCAAGSGCGSDPGRRRAAVRKVSQRPPRVRAWSSTSLPARGSGRPRRAPLSATMRPRRAARSVRPARTRRCSTARAPPERERSSSRLEGRPARSTSVKPAVGPGPRAARVDRAAAARACA